MSLLLKANQTSNNKKKKKDNQMTMGLSSKEVSSDSVDWTQNLLLQSGGLETPKPPQERQQQQQQQQTQPLQCPRCNSTNTKFCYYNNYNRSQPRHFCKSCRRHWTKGGTLRNVPVGGVRKNKRHKTATTNTNQSGNTNSNTNMAIQQPLTFFDQKNISDILRSTLQQPSPPQLPVQLDYINNIDNNGSSNSSSSGGSFMGSFCSLPLMTQFSPFAATSSYENDLSSSVFSNHPNLFNYTSPTTKDIILENSKGSGFVLDQSQLPISAAEATTTIAAATPFQFPTSNYIDLGGYWNWDDLCMFGSIDTRMPSNNDLQQGI